MVEQRSSIWPIFVGEDAITVELAKPKAELYDIKVAPLAKEFMERHRSTMLQAIELKLPVIAGDYARSTAHWLHVHERFLGATAATGFELK